MAQEQGWPAYLLQRGHLLQRRLRDPNRYTHLIHRLPVVLSIAIVAAIPPAAAAAFVVAVAVAAVTVPRGVARPRRHHHHIVVWSIRRCFIQSRVCEIAYDVTSLISNFFDGSSGGILHGFSMRGGGQRAVSEKITENAFVRAARRGQI